MDKFYQKIALLFLSLMATGTVAAADPVAFEVYESFDDASHFTSDATIPDNWVSTGTYAFTRNTGNYFGCQAKSGEYVFAVPQSYSYDRDEVFYTPMMKLSGGKPCTIMFSMLAPGGMPANVRNNGLTITAGTAQSADAQTITVGKVENGAYTTWTDYAFSFKPESDGEYCIGFKLNCTMATSGIVAIDEINISGYSPAEPAVAEVILSPFYANIPTAFVGESYTATVNVKATGLVEDIAIANVSTSEIVPAVESIPMSQAMSDAGYDLVVTMTPSGMESYGGSFELTTANLAEPVVFQMFWTAVSATEKDNLQAIKTSNPEDYMAYKYTGEAVVTFVDVENGRVYMQDGTAGVRVMADVISDVKVGDKVSNQYFGLTPEDDGLTLISLTESLNVISTGNVVVPKEVSFRKIAANPSEYINELVKVREVGMLDSSVTVFSAQSDSVTDGTVAVVKPFVASGVAGTSVPEMFNLVGVMTCDSAAVVSPRSVYDIEEIFLEPVPGNYGSAYELPYFNTFDNYDNDYDGTTVVPAGWKSVGSSPFFTANINTVAAVTGTYYIVADESADDERDDRLYTPMFRMIAGTEYEISYYLYMPGNSGGGVLRATDLRVTVGTEQDVDFQPITVQLIEDQSISSFTKQTFKFTPEITGAYCFAFSLNTEVNYSGQVAIDDFNVTAPGLTPYPTANFGIGGIYEVYYSNMLTYPGKPVKINNMSVHADSYNWTVTCPDATVLTSTEENPEFIFDQNGNYIIALDAKNKRGTRSTSKTAQVQYVSGNYDGSVMTFDPNHDIMYERGLLPSFADKLIEDYNYDFVSGYNRFYRKMAERFEFPENVNLEINTLNVWLGHYRNRAYTNGYDSEKPFSIVFYGETDGRIDTTKVFARIESTLMDVFGNTGIGGSAGEPRDVNFLNLNGAPVKTSGSFYLAFEYADDITVTTTDYNAGRSYMGMNTIEHASGEATLYAMPTKVPNNSTVKADGNWYRIDEIDPTKKALGNYFILWAKSELSSIAVNQLGDIVFATRVEGDNLYVSGVSAGETVMVYNLNGQLVASAVAQGSSVTVAVGGLDNGVYIVKAANGTAKFVK